MTSAPNLTLAEQLERDAFLLDFEQEERRRHAERSRLASISPERQRELRAQWDAFLLDFEQEERRRHAERSRRLLRCENDHAQTVRRSRAADLPQPPTGDRMTMLTCPRDDDAHANASDEEKELDCIVTFSPSEPMTRDYPGCDGETEVEILSGCQVCHPEGSPQQENYTAAEWRQIESEAQADSRND